MAPKTSAHKLQRQGVLQPLHESAGNNKVQMQEPSQRTSPICWQNTSSSPSHEENSVTPPNEIIQGALATPSSQTAPITTQGIAPPASNEAKEQFGNRKEPRLEGSQRRKAPMTTQGLAPPACNDNKRPEPQFDNKKEPRQEGSQEGQYSCRQQTS